MVGEKGNRPVSKEVSKHRILRKSESQKEQENKCCKDCLMVGIGIGVVLLKKRKYASNPTSGYKPKRIK